MGHGSLNNNKKYINYHASYSYQKEIINKLYFKYFDNHNNIFWKFAINNSSDLWREGYVK